MLSVSPVKVSTVMYGGSGGMGRLTDDLTDYDRERMSLDASEPAVCESCGQPVEPRRCRRCGAAFRPSRKDQVYHSNMCARAAASAAYRARQREMA
jgi:predicted amidophosphoribosyltransferase